jgi:hypothetical protein
MNANLQNRSSENNSTMIFDHAYLSFKVMAAKKFAGEYIYIYGSPSSCKRTASSHGDTDAHDGDVNVLNGNVEVFNGNVEIFNRDANVFDGNVEFFDGNVKISDGNAKVFDGDVEFFDSDVKISDGDVEIFNGDVEIRHDNVEFFNDDVEFFDSNVEFFDGDANLSAGDKSFVCNGSYKNSIYGYTSLYKIKKTNNENHSVKIQLCGSLCLLCEPLCNSKCIMQRNIERSRRDIENRQVLIQMNNLKSINYESL